MRSPKRRSPGWLQSDGFVGQYATGTNRSLTIEAMTVTTPSTSGYVGPRHVFPDDAPKRAVGRDAGPVARLSSHPSLRRAAAALRRAVGAHARGRRHGRAGAALRGRRSRSSRRTCAACSRPRATSRSANAAVRRARHDLGELVRGLQQLSCGSGSSRGFAARKIARPNRHDMLVAVDPGRRRPAALRRRDRVRRRAKADQARGDLRASRRRRQASKRLEIDAHRGRSARWTSTTSRPRAAST